MDNKFEEIYIKQQELNDLYKELAKDTNIGEILSLNKSIKEDNIKLINEKNSLKNNNAILQKEKNELLIKLREHTVNEKVQLINNSKKKMKIYFEENKKNGLNKLLVIERDVKTKINNMYTLIDKNLMLEKDSIKSRLDEVHKDIVKEMEKQKDYVLKSKSRNMNKLEEAYREIRETEITDEMQKKIQKMNSIELKIGLNTLNYIGIILILLSLVTLGRYAYVSYFSDILKTIALFTGSILLVGLGEVSKRKRFDKISLGFFGGGIAALYISVFVTTFYLSVFSITTGLAVSVIITAISVYLTYYNNSLIIGSLALIGGYLPLYSYLINYGFTETNIMGMIIYTLLFYAVILLLAVHQKWQLLNMLSFVMSIPWVLILVDNAANISQGLVVTIIVFIMYLTSVFSYKLLYKIPLTYLDAVILVLNNVFNMILVTYLFTEYTQVTNFGFLACIYALIYGTLYYVVNKVMPYEKVTKAIMFIFTAASVFIFFPLQFMEHEGLYESMWAILGAVILYQALNIDSKPLKVTGYVFLFSAMIVMFVTEYQWKIELITTVIIIVSLAVVLYLNSYKYRKLSEDIDYTVFKNLAAVYSIAMIYLTTDKVMRIGFDLRYTDHIYIALTQIYIGNVLGYILLKLKKLDLKIIGSLLITATLFYTLFINTQNIEITYQTFAVVMLVLQNLLLILSTMEVALFISNKFINVVSYIPLILSVYVILSITSIMVSQFKLANEDVILSVIYLLIAVGSVYYGIKFNNPVSRRFGLGLTFITLGKYFIVDLIYLETVWKIGAYFVFGLLVILISVIYQKFSKDSI